MNSRNWNRNRMTSPRGVPRWTPRQGRRGGGGSNGPGRAGWQTDRRSRQHSPRLFLQEPVSTTVSRRNEPNQSSPRSSRPTDPRLRTKSNFKVERSSPSSSVSKLFEQSAKMLPSSSEGRLETSIHKSSDQFFTFPTIGMTVEQKYHHYKNETRKLFKDLTETVHRCKTIHQLRIAELELQLAAERQAKQDLIDNMQSMRTELSYKDRQVIALKLNLMKVKNQGEELVTPRKQLAQQSSVPQNRETDRSLTTTKANSKIEIVILDDEADDQAYKETDCKMDVRVKSEIYKN